MTEPDDRARADAVIHAFGERSRSFFRGERRDQLDSVLFDVPRRSLLGWDGIYQYGPDFLDEITGQATPEEIGTRMRRLGQRPYQLQFAILALGYLGAREQRRLNLGLGAGEPLPGEDVERTIRFLLTWERMQRAYRGDGSLLPEEAGGVTRVVDEAVVDEVWDGLVPIADAPLKVVKRASAILNSYAFLLHGEQRDGTFGHGPYPRPDGTTVWFREVTDLRNGYLPWASGDNPFPNVVFAYACREVRVTTDLYGSLVTEPFRLDDRLTHVGALSVGPDGTLRTLDEGDLQAAEAAAAQGVKGMYAEMATWEPRFRLDYGRMLFANHLKTFVDLLGLAGDWGERLRGTFVALSSDLIDRLYTEKETPSVWAHMVRGESACFSPITPWPEGARPP